MANSPGKPNQLKSMGRSIIIGGTAAGILSLIPIINLLNLFFMMWMALGGGITAYLLIKANKDIKTADALLAGSLSGVWGCVLFGTFAYITLTHIPLERIERAAALVQSFFPNIGEDAASILQPDNLKGLFFIIIALAMLFSLISGAVGSIISRSIFRRKEDDE